MSFSHRILFPFLLSPSPFPFSHSLFLWKLTRPTYDRCKWIAVAETMVPDPELIYPVSTYLLAVLASMLLPWKPKSWIEDTLKPLYDTEFSIRLEPTVSINQIINYGGVIPGTGKPGELPSMGSYRVRHDWSDLAAAAAVILYNVCSVS